jgi:N-acetylmuramic acid 6-phosphate etherase
MTNRDFRDPRATEQRNPRSERVDVASSLEIVDVMNAEDAGVPAAVHAQREPIAAGIDLIVNAFRTAGRLVYVGAGTSGRLGVLDATECPPTFGTPPEMVVGVIAGGYGALVKSAEGAENDVNRGAQDVDTAGVTNRDVVVGIAASGTTPYVRAALGRAQTIGARTMLVTCAIPPKILADTCDVVVQVIVGPEVLTGSTRLKAGTATKLVLNTLTTGAMIRLGKVYGNLMVDLMALSAKLKDRGERIVMECCGVARDEARSAIERAGGSVKLAIVMARRGVDAAEARRLLDAADGFVRRVVGDPPAVSRS